MTVFCSPCGFLVEALSVRPTVTKGAIYAPGAELATAELACGHTATFVRAVNR